MKRSPRPKKPRGKPRRIYVVECDGALVYFAKRTVADARDLSREIKSGHAGRRMRVVTFEEVIPRG